MNQTQRKYDECIYAIDQLIGHLESVLEHKVLLPDYYRDLTNIKEKCDNMVMYYTQKRDNYDQEQILRDSVEGLVDLGYDTQTIKTIVDKKLGVNKDFFKND